jgi:hypothetical protein
MGNLVEAAGIACLTRVIMGCTHGFMTPNCHLHQINPHAEKENKENYLTEVLEFPMDSSYYGCTSRGMGGTNVHCLVFGSCDAWKLPDTSEEQKPVAMNFWPAGGGDMEETMYASGYFIAGTFNNWNPEKMSDMGGGTYGYTMTLGENRWEDFSVMLDKDKNRTLHPQVAKGIKGCAVDGPDGNQTNCWRIVGINQVVENGGTPALSDEGGAKSGMLELTSGDSGKPGDKYRIMLKVAGKFKTVVWEKLGESSPDSVTAGSYYVTGNFNGWTFSPMTKDGDAWTCEVLLLRTCGEFQIVRNEDWHQVICPTTHKATALTDGYGPDDAVEARGYTWFIDGVPGDVFKIKFTRKATEEFGPSGFDLKEVTWEKLRTDTLNTEQKILAERPHFGAVGTWNGWTGPMTELAFESQELGRSMCFVFYVIIGPSGQESFQLLHDLDWNNVVHPSRPAPVSTTPHYVLFTSPNDGSAMNLVWTIGEGDGAYPGATYAVKAYSRQGYVAQVTWSQVQQAPQGQPVVSGYPF